MMPFQRYTILPLISANPPRGYINLSIRESDADFLLQFRSSVAHAISRRFTPA
jgi:hypothetical protein